MWNRFAVVAVLALATASTGAEEAGTAKTRALSAYFGAVILPGTPRGWCPSGEFGGFGGMPFVLTRQVDAGEGFGGAAYALDPNSFRVTVGAQGRVVTPVCATLNPAVDKTELNTVLLAGDFGIGGDDMPTRIQVVGDVRTVDGESLRGLEVDSIYPPDAGSNLLRATVYDPADGTIDTSGAAGNAYCPERTTTKVVKLTFSGGVRGPNGGALADDVDAMAAILVLGLDSDGNRTVLNPSALRDDDNDNFLDACFGDEVDGLTLIRVSVNSHVFYSPMNAPNRAAAIEIGSP
ncbi:MAG TPA: hypothetical protein VGG06_04605 [Thermoanaerobaculia bacterium]|jgi:hypothetical protein